MKVVHTSPPMGPAYGGPFQSVRNLAIAGVATGLDVKVLMPWSAEAAAHVPDWSPVEVALTGRVVIPPLGWSPRFYEILRASGADVLHTHGIWQHPSWVALKWKKETNRPHVSSVRGMLEPWAWQHHAWKKRPVWELLERRNLQSADLLHATSEQEAQSFRERGLKTPIATIPNGVNLPAPNALSSNSGFKIHHQTRTALFLSRLHPKKGLAMLLEAWAKLRPEGWRLRIVGPDEGGHVEELKRLCVKLGLQWEDLSNIEYGTSNPKLQSEAGWSNIESQNSNSLKIHYSGALTGDAKDAAFRDSDLFILPTHSENFGIAVAEALAHGLPVITTQGAPWKLLESERCGWWVSISVEGIATALDDATRRSPEELFAMGERGRVVVAERFAWDGIARQFVECYRWLLGEGEEPDCVRRF